MSHSAARQTPGKAQPHYLLLGEVLRPHGIVGELRMRVLTAYPERLAELATIYVGYDPEAPDATPYTLESVRMHQGYALLKLAGVTDRNAAERFRQMYVMVPLEDAVPLAEGEHYLYQLIGLNVQTEDGETLGTVADILETGANDVYVVESQEYGEVLIPDLDETILKIDVEANTMIVRLLDGLLPRR